MFLALPQIEKNEKVSHPLFVSITIIFCGFPGGSISIKHSQYDQYYEMTAKFNPDKTDNVDRYLEKESGAGNIFFTNTIWDADITLDNKATFYIKKHRIICI